MPKPKPKFKTLVLVLDIDLYEQLSAIAVARGEDIDATAESMLTEVLRDSADV